jgi:hypothetical protein
MEEGRNDSSRRLQFPLLIDMGLYVYSHSVKWRSHTFENVGFKMETAGQGRRISWLWHMPNLEEFGFHVGPSFIGYRQSVSVPIQDGGFVRWNLHSHWNMVDEQPTWKLALKTSIFKQDWKRTVVTKNEEEGPPLNQAPQDSAHVQVKNHSPWPTELHLKTGVLIRGHPTVRFMLAWMSPWDNRQKTRTQLGGRIRVQTFSYIAVTDRCSTAHNGPDVYHRLCNIQCGGK